MRSKAGLMNSFLEDDDAARQSEERELTLNTGTILGIFVALVVLCGAFFGFGYKMGSHRSTPPEVIAANTNDADTNFTDFKPAAGSPENVDEHVPVAVKPSAEERKVERAATTIVKPAAAASDSPATRPREGAASHAEIAPSSESAAPPVGTYFVQVAAVSHQEDAQLLIHALKAKGYPVGAHTQPQDKFYHVQVGPFDSRKDADAAKQKLLADGYQPIIK